jgi:hypothetical protein
MRKHSTFSSHTDEDLPNYPASELNSHGPHVFGEINIIQKHKNYISCYFKILQGGVQNRTQQVPKKVQKKSS